MRGVILRLEEAKDSRSTPRHQGYFRTKGGELLFSIRNQRVLRQDRLFKIIDEEGSARPLLRVKWWNPAGCMGLRLWQVQLKHIKALIRPRSRNRKAWNHNDKPMVRKRWKRR